MSAATDFDASAALLEQVRQALANGTPLRIQGSNSKAFLGRDSAGEILDTRSHRGIVSYDPTELVITARAGTPLSELHATLDAAGQMLPCEPPSFGDGATLGGMLASGLSGPRRPWAGAVRDYVLGTRLISGSGQLLRFGGEVMKNVAGYDLSRLMAGSYGCLGVITEVSLKVLPKPRQCLSLSLEMDRQKALTQLAEWGQQPLPISAACHDGERLHLRLEGGEGSVTAAHDRLGGDPLDSGYWSQLNEQQLAFFDPGLPLWRLSLPHNTALLGLPGTQLLDWGGAQRWLRCDAPAEHIRSAASAVGGHASCYSHGLLDSPFQPLAPTLLHYHQRLKAQLDPQGIFNPGRLYAEL
ncbi:glycolate oxidase subunit GlcE [Pseudomonas sp. Fl5BN2]|uniref:glycolate oxidase subunit GlcE n=1 Tax=Pseudomonas sp. Fl5BN2 TaxID=2697652 RepID=UPI0013788DBB|nr:glycolate oxidase subunit GlcE [Pseudomonas sp. Fl5BN2]NBF06539.1 glycolate oxidase subunit GlcE [Pseudomonas sp. Fl5BN2]